MEKDSSVLKILICWRSVLWYNFPPCDFVHLCRVDQLGFIFRSHCCCHCPKLALLTVGLHGSNTSCFVMTLSSSPIFSFVFVFFFVCVLLFVPFLSLLVAASCSV